jgi:hypothetical protein
MELYQIQYAATKPSTISMKAIRDLELIYSADRPTVQTTNVDSNDLDVSKLVSGARC